MTTAPEKLRAWMVANDLSYADLAEKLGVSKTTAFKWATGKTTPEYPHARRISKVTRRTIRIAEWSDAYAAE